MEKEQILSAMERMYDRGRYIGEQREFEECNRVS